MLSAFIFSFRESDLYSPVFKAKEARLLLALAALEGVKVIKTETKQAYLYRDMGDDVVYILPPDWWQNLFSRGTFLAY